jgi:hypothetical protein
MKDSRSSNTLEVVVVVALAVLVAIGTLALDVRRVYGVLPASPEQWEQTPVRSEKARPAGD